MLRFRRLPHAAGCSAGFARLRPPACLRVASLPRHRLLSSSAATDPYRILNCRPGCTDKELKQAFRKAAKRWHPDMQQERDAIKAEQMFKRVSEAYEAAVAQRSGKQPRPGAPSGGTQQSDAWHQRQQQYQREQSRQWQQWQYQNQQGSSSRQQAGDRERQRRRMRSEHERAQAFIERIKGSVLASAVLLCVLFSGTPSTRDDIFAPIRRLLGTQRDPAGHAQTAAAAGVLEMDVEEGGSGGTAPPTQFGETRYPAAWMARAVKEEALRHPQGTSHGTPMGAGGVAVAKAEWLARQGSSEKYSTAVEDIAEAQRRAREGRPPLKKKKQSATTEQEQQQDWQVQHVQEQGQPEETSTLQWNTYSR